MKLINNSNVTHIVVNKETEGILSIYGRWINMKYLPYKKNKWWGDNNSGYTDDKRYAGVYLESNILADQSYYNNGVSTKAVLI